MENWYLQTGRNSDVVISTRIRIARNFKNLQFPNQNNEKDLKKVYEKMEEITPLLGYGLKFIKLSKIDDLTKLSLVEKHLISPEMAKSRNPYSALIINDEETICIMINEEDHLRIQVFNSGLDIENTMNLSIELDEKIEELLDYAYHNKFGYLTACPTNVGTGTKASIMVHLPALSLTKNISKILNVVNNFGMNIRGIYGEGSESEGNIYQISNTQTMGVAEKEIVKNLNSITDKLIEQERLARKFLAKNKIELEDRVYRAYGIFTSARRITQDESIKLLSDIKLGVDLGIIEELDDKKIFRLMIYTKPANLQKYMDKNMDGFERDIRRSEVIKQIIKNVK